MQLGSHFTGKLFVIKRYVVLGIRKARHQGTRAFTLVGGLAIGCRIREFFIIENPIGVQSFDFTLQSVEIQIFNGSIQVKTAGRTYLEIASCLSVI